METTFKGSFTQQEAIPDDAIAAAVDVLKSGRLHRYNQAGEEAGETALLEQEFGAWQGAAYCLAVTSGGQAMQIALRAAGVQPDDGVLTNAFTLAPVPGAIHAVGGKPVLVEIDDTLRIDMSDLANKASRSGARYLLLSLMRGHVCDMDKLMEIARAHGLTVIEDCAHTMGAKWRDLRSGNFGLAGCFSTQTYKHMNSGEGGLLTSNDAGFIARATILSGSYMLYARHGRGPDETAYVNARQDMANMSARMDNLRAAILRPQLRTLDANIDRWNARYAATYAALEQSNHITLPVRPAAERMVGSSIQFGVPDLDASTCLRLLSSAQERGVELKWFGRPEPQGFTSAHRSWGYVAPHHLPQTDRILSTLFDMRLPLTLSLEDCTLIGEIVADVVNKVVGEFGDTSEI